MKSDDQYFATFTTLEAALGYDRALHGGFLLHYEKVTDDATLPSFYSVGAPN
jgi:hypothetical protein